MGKSGTGKGTPQSTKRTTEPKRRKGAVSPRSKSPLIKRKATPQISRGDEEEEIPEPGGCCEACDGLATGLWGIPWRDAAGTWHCLEGVAGDKVLKGDENGPYWANP